MLHYASLHSRDRATLLAVALLTCTACGTDGVGPAPDPMPDLPGAVVSVAIGNTVTNPDATRLFGVTFEGRTSMGVGAGLTPAGLYDRVSGALLPGVAAFWNGFPLVGVRYPGNAVEIPWDWKGTIGPVSTRPLQLLSNNTPTQRVAFGFDEFMAMTAAKGVAAADVQIMVIIYPTAAAPDPAASAADWVEYANSPNDGTNPRGGTQWAAVRAANGHPAPYGIRIWNIGNEPWSPKEFNFNPTPYIAIALPIIDAMREVDPTIRITIPALGTTTSPWNSGILASTPLTSRVWGLSPHYFYSDAGPVTLTQVEAGLQAVASQAAAKGLTVIVGDHAHEIKNTNDAAARDLAMQWQGALTTAGFLVVAAQVGNVDRANYWIFGMPSAVWHPVRANTDGSYTTMAVASLYELLAPLALPQALATTTLGSAGGTIPVRAAAFRTANGGALNLVVVNGDPAADRQLAPPQLPGFTLTRARRLSAPALTSDAFTVTAVAPTVSGQWALPRASVLVLEFLARGP